MTQAIKKAGRTVAPFLLVGFLALLSAGTIANQLRINHTNDRLAAQARAGQLGLNRTCALLPISKKIYADMLNRRIITPNDFALIFQTADHVCASATPTKR